MFHKFPQFIVALTLLLSILACQKAPTQLSIEQSQLNAKIQKQFPRTKTLDEAKKYSLTLLNPKVQLIAKPNTPGHLELDVDLKLNRKGIPLALNGHATLMGKIRYDKQAHTFWADQLQLKAIDIPVLSTVLSKEEQTHITQKINTTLTLFWPKIPLYTLKSSARDKVVKTMLQDIKIESGRLVLVF